jgi:diphthine-ammonia ligase
MIHFMLQSRFPDVEGVSCGTIISTYQRFRVEHTCQRLGLTPLSYLWQRDRGELLLEMLRGGLEAVLVKTAGAGLVPGKHLGELSLGGVWWCLMVAVMLGWMYG